MDAPTVSIVMAYWDRGSQLDRTLASIARQDYPGVEVVIIPDIRPRVKSWLNPAPLLNEGIRRAKGEILILQNPECEHISPNVIQRLCDILPGTASFAQVAAMKENGTFDRWYCHRDHRRVPWFFCGSVYKADVLRVSGFAESFTGYGGEDVDFAERLAASGVEFAWPDDILVHHQWHGYPEGVNTGGCA